jgi:hypothetical protein
MLFASVLYSSRCKFCERELSEKEKGETHGLCHECYHLRRIIWGMDWHKKRVRSTSDLATKREILAWLCSGKVPHKG